MNSQFLVLMASAAVLTRATDENKAVFQDMCRVLRLTLKQPEVPGDVDVREKAQKVLDTIQMLNFSLADPQLIAYISKAETLGEAKTANEATKSLSDGDWGFLKKHFATMKGDGPTSLSSKVPRQTSEASRTAAHYQIGLIYEQAKELFGTLSSEDLSLEKAVKQARKSLVAAAYGSDVAGKEGGKSDPDAASKKGEVAAEDTSFYTNTAGSKIGCGGVAHNGNIETGKTLAADILCLCEPNSGGVGTSNSKCGLSSLSAHSSSWTTPTSGKEAWAIVQAGCTQTPSGETTPSPTPENLNEALARFYGLLGTGGKVGSGSFAATALKGRSYILGAFATYQGNKPECDGQSPDGSGASKGICVNYYPLIEAGKQIPWVKNVKDAIAHLQRVRELFHQQRDILNKMEFLEIAARQAVALFTTVPTETSPSTGGDATAKGAAKSINQDGTPIQGTETQKKESAFIPRFIVPWTLLI